jgi:hypothetical protein
MILEEKTIYKAKKFKFDTSKFLKLYKNLIDNKAYD